MILPMEGDEASGWKPGKPTVFLSTPFVEASPEFSPDGRWIAYTSNESGRFEVYVRPFPGPGGKWQVSTDGGGVSLWSRVRREIFYINVGGMQTRIMVAPYVVEGDSFLPEKPGLLSQTQILVRPPFRPFDLHPDGQRFAVAKAPEEKAQVKKDKVVFVFNFSEILRRIAPGKR